ncbi:MAG: hypothetical protein AAFR58_07380 [Cyanobacteria bacterium J06627_28]
MGFKQLLKTLEASQSAKSPLYKALQKIAKLETTREINIGTIRSQLRKVEKLLAAPEISVSDKAKVKEHLTKYANELRDTDSQIRRKFGGELDKALKPLGFSLSGNYPTLKTNLYTFKLDFETYKATIWFGPEQEKLSECRLRASDVVKDLKKNIKNLETNLNQETFTTKLKQAHHRVATDSSRSIPITSVLPELAFLLQKESFYQNPVQDNYRSYGRADFSYDLFRFGKFSLTQGMQLTVAVKQYTRRRQDFLWIPSNQRGDGTLYSHLQFKQ